MLSIWGVKMSADKKNKKMLQVLEFLNRWERKIAEHLYGLNGKEELTQKEVAQKMGISQSYISRLEKRIMQRLKKEILRQTNCA